MSELTRVGEQAFPFPWNISFYGDGVHYIETDSDRGFWIMEEKGDGSTKQPDSAEGRAAMKYIVSSANLMPEAVEIIKLACFSPCRDLCKYAKNGAPSIDVPECDYCPEGAFYERAKNFLAKLEGGAEERNERVG